MSAFGAIVRFDGGPVAREDLARLAAGLDGPFLRRSEIRVEDATGFLYRALPVTSEDAWERQPLAGGGGSRVLLFDGRLDNRDALSAALDLPAGPDPALPDSALVLAALDRWGEGALPRMIGDFALALWDDATRRLLLACDPLGHRSLYYHCNDRLVAVATTVRGLLALPQVPRRLNETALADLLSWRLNEVQDTFYQDIRRVPRAARVVIDSRGAQVARYWTPDPERRLHLARDDDYVEAARELLDRAVACRLRAAGPLTAMMSGGYDSPAVVTAAARHRPAQGLTAFTLVPPAGRPVLVPPGRYADERPFVAAIARRHPNLTIHYLEPGEPGQAIDNPESLFAASALPTHNISNDTWIQMMFERAGAMGARAMLTGHHGNFSLTWNGLRHLGELARTGRWWRLAHELRHTARRRGEAVDLLARAEVIAPMLPTGLRHLRRRLLGREAQDWASHSGLNPDFRREQGLTGDHFQAPADGRAARIHYFTRWQEIAQEIFGTLRHRTGVEIRNPLGDVRLIEFCLAIPQDQFLRDGHTRWLARRVLADRLPPEVLDNPLRGYQMMPWTRWLAPRRDTLMAEIERLEGSAMACRLLDLPRLKALAAAWPQDEATLVGNKAIYHDALWGSVHIGRFIRWVEGGNG